jgi:fimbrial chaperone protein
MSKFNCASIEMRIFIIAFTTLVLAANSSLAYRLEPLIVTLTPSGEQSRNEIVITNTLNKRIALQFKMLERSVTRDGQETRAPEKKDFVIAPPQTLLDPGEKQMVRIQYVGPSNIDSENAYRLIADPVQVRKPENMEGTQVNVLIRYEAAIYVAPPDASPEVVVKNVTVAEAQPSKTRLMVTFQNRGTRHLLPENETLAVEHDGERLSLTDQALENFRTTNFLAGSTINLPIVVQGEIDSVEGLSVVIR